MGYGIVFFIVKMTFFTRIFYEIEKSTHDNQARKPSHQSKRNT